MGQYLFTDACDLRDNARECVFCPENGPVHGEKDDGTGCNKLLERPASFEPFTGPELGLLSERMLVIWNIVEVYIAYARFGVPREHGVDCLRKLSTAHLVDAAGVNPNVLVAMYPGESTGAGDLGPEGVLVVALQVCLDMFRIRVAAPNTFILRM